MSHNNLQQMIARLVQLQVLFQLPSRKANWSVINSQFKDYVLRNGNSLIL